ncbi:hypothetical protein CHH28_15350 [Bacterioplanes sanyensis]|uniref:Uncharacterized protein n=1 Tax=Bacterioplanes sanyensis TaxID=1249553 RepID=A0A222FMQ8_9GAMM|nr:hypothetical protein [Bacterioplanes sanyensis]ASP39962.1 hypothetical protein CHH28_15350 [Bacterioplanes sanyensis]
MRDLLAARTQQRSVHWSFDARVSKAFNEQQLMDEVMEAYQENRNMMLALAKVDPDDMDAVRAFEKALCQRFSVGIGEL